MTPRAFMWLCVSENERRLGKVWSKHCPGNVYKTVHYLWDKLLWRSRCNGIDLAAPNRSSPVGLAKRSFQRTFCHSSSDPTCIPDVFVFSPTPCRQPRLYPTWASVSASAPNFAWVSMWCWWLRRNGTLAAVNKTNCFGNVDLIFFENANWKALIY